MKRKHDVRSRWHTSVRLVQMQLEVSQMILSSTAKELRDSQLVDNRWRNVWIDAQGKRLGVTASGKNERKTGRQTEERTNERTNKRTIATALATRRDGNWDLHSVCLFLPVAPLFISVQKLLYFYNTHAHLRVSHSYD